MRKSIIFFVMVIVIAPIVLYTNTLAVYFASFSLDVFVEDHHYRANIFGGEIRPLKDECIQTSAEQKTYPTVKQPLGGAIHLQNLVRSDPNFSELNRGLTQQLTYGNTATNSLALRSSNGGDHEVLGEDEVEDEEEEEEEEEGEAEDEHKDEDEHQKDEQQPSNRSSQATTAHVSVGRTERIARKREESDALIRLLKGQLVQANVYLSLTATRDDPHFVDILQSRIKDIQHTLGTATKDTELPRNARERSMVMEQTLLKGKRINDECVGMGRKLRSMLRTIQEQVQEEGKLAQFLTHLAAKTMPKGLHCLPLRLTIAYFTLNSSLRQFPDDEGKLDDPNLYHYALFSDNVLAASVVVNSTISHAKDPSKHVFHVVTDELNYAAMKMWFIANPPGEATIQVQNVESMTWLNASYHRVLKTLHTYARTEGSGGESNEHRNPEDLSVMNHLRFYLPAMFPNLSKILFLDDDVVVQKDLSPLWSIDLQGKVIGVVETCGKNFHQYDHYLNFSNSYIIRNINHQACSWAFGMNIVDLDQWRQQNITKIYHKWQNRNKDRLLWKQGTMPAGLVTFWSRTHALDKSWHVTGLGYNPDVQQTEIDQAAVLHYSGNLKPWLEIAILKYRSYWVRYVNYESMYVRACNIEP